MDEMLRCNHCGKPIQTVVSPNQKGEYICESCQRLGLIELEQDQDGQQSLPGHELTGDYRPVRWEKPELLIPEGLEVLDLENEFDVRIRWWKSKPRNFFWFLFLFGAFWNGILSIFVLVAIGSGIYEMLLGLSLHILVGLGIFYSIMSYVLNTTSISLMRDRLQIRTFPLPVFGFRNRTVNSDEIQQLYVTRYVSSKTNGQPNYAFALYAIIKGGEKLKLVSGMNKETQLYLEAAMEEFLGIKDQPGLGIKK